MALSVEQIQQAYIAFFNRPADSEGLAFWRTYPGDQSALLDQFAQSDEYLSDYRGLSDADMVNKVYQNLFGRPAEAGGLAYWTQMMQEGWITISNVAFEVLGGAQNDDAIIINNKTLAATHFTDALDQADEQAGYDNAGPNGVGDLTKNWLSAVTADADSLTQADNALDSLILDLVNANKQMEGGSDPGEGGIDIDENNVPAGYTPLYGTDGDDALLGTNGKDFIIGRAGNDNLIGEAGDDMLFGGAGNDYLAGQEGNDTLDGGPGNDTLVIGGQGSDICIFYGASTGNPRDLSYDVLLDFDEGIDIIHVTDRTLKIVSHARTGSEARIGPNGEANFKSETITLLDRLEAVAEAFAKSGGQTEAGEVAAFEMGDDDFLLISDAVDGLSDNDILIQGDFDDLHLINGTDLTLV